MSSEALRKNALEMIQLLRQHNFPVGKGEGQWRAIPISEPESENFEDEGQMNDFTGVLFMQGSDKFYNAPEELGVERNSNGTWSKFVAPEIRAAKGIRTDIETGISAPKSSSELRSWDSRKISKYLLGEAENYEALYACIIAQLENVPTDEARNSIEQLHALMETITEPVSKTKKVLEVQDEEEELSKAMEKMTVTKKKVASPKAKPKSPSPKKPVSPPKKDLAKLEKLIATYKKKLEEKQPTASVADAIARLAKELGVSDDDLGDNYDFYGFGRSRLQANRRKSRRRSTKKVKKMTHRTSKAKRKVRTSGRSMKRNKRRTSKQKTGKKLSKFKKSFGSAIYGLQGGMQNGPIYSGVYPMTLKVNSALPNLNNVKRSFSLNEFGTRKRQSPKKKTSGNLSKMDRRGKRTSKKISRMATVVENDDGADGGNGFGSCGLYGCGSCGRSFGSCGCNGSKDDQDV
jgi:hypothetical protein